jgi:ribosomal protein L11 methyltransferase
MARVWPALDVSVGSPFDRSEIFQAALADFNITAINEEPLVWRVFFQTSAERDRAHEMLQTMFSDLAFTPVDVPDENWAARSQAALRAVRVGAIVVAPPWDVPEASRDTRVIVIQPSMGFGTGHHSTTRLCLDALQRVDLRHQSVIDVGTGSGVLAIAASLLGAASVVGFDDDADAVTAARENLELNPDARVTLEVSDVRGDGGGTGPALSPLRPQPADVVLSQSHWRAARRNHRTVEAIDETGRAADPEWVF